ncbi:hypothetical protein BCY91_06155 [Pelobium manganitolerans]|uniref:Uncharacterized protein n=2 Tax=Pelobium manganitolerans TaxID=1842495 RepID=A0A419S4V2_9SPHI|nr:hypothetical protein BCY91_06155 [Pelobium manganitolerans]
MADNHRGTMGTTFSTRNVGLETPCSSSFFCYQKQQKTTAFKVGKKSVNEKSKRMLKNISWSDYIIAVAILLAIYYLFVGMKYFSGEIKDLLSGKRKLKFRAAVSNDHAAYNPDNEESLQETSGFEETTDDEFSEVEHLIERLKAVIADASRRKLIPQEFKQFLSMVLKEYPSVRYSPIRSSINELIVSECQKYGAVTLNEDEVELLWKEAV